MEQTGTTKGFYYVHSDYLGSIEYVTDQNGSLDQELSYDPWGRLRNPVDWSYSSIPSPKFDRGFTTHEHLEEFDLINMNGRVYDPLLGIFLSPDPYVQAPDYSQNFNRYGYGLNNPMKYTDPTGEWFITAFATIGGAYLGGMQANGYELNPGNWDWGSANTYYSIAKGGISGYTFGATVENKLNAFSDIQKIRSGEMPSLYEYMNTRSEPSFYSDNLLASNEFGGYGDKPPLTPADFQALDAEYQLAYNTSYAFHYGNTYDLYNTDLFDFKSMTKVLRPKSTNFGPKLFAGKIRDTYMAIYSNHGIKVDGVSYFSPATSKSKGMGIIIDKSFFPIPNFRGGNTKYPFAIRIGGTQYGKSSDIATFYFKSYEALMRWGNFIRDPMTYYKTF